MNKSINFELYRYQLLPISQQHQFDLFDEITTVEELVQQKNVIFARCVKEMKEFYHQRADIISKRDFIDNYIVIRIGVNRSLVVTNKDFQEDFIDNWPYVVIVINNDPEVQLVALQTNYKAFEHNTTLVKILQDSINSCLQKYHLVFRLFPIFEQYKFWQIIKNHPGEIRRVKFHMISPNLANIAKGLKIELEELKKTTNTQETDIVFTSDRRSSLTLSPDDAFVGSLVDYSSLGGGDIKIKIKGIRKEVSTNQSTTTRSIDSVEINSDDPLSILREIRRWLK